MKGSFKTIDKKISKYYAKLQPDNKTKQGLRRQSLPDKDVRER